ncbi:MAG TPA: serine hydrolase domain-containing protein, partial [Vicinamibacteria bacterium]|nr:serine hydrolase domain-containing protein [Vicinamibacteria bacterium]
RDLVTHVGGWEGDLFVDTGQGDDAVARIVAEMRTLEQQAPAGAYYSYNNAGFYAAARILEVASGKTYEDLLEDELLEPLGLGQCFIRPADVMTHRFVVGHLNLPAGIEVGRPWPIARAAHAVGGLTCSVRDLLAYARFHLGNGRTRTGRTVLSAEAILAMREPIYAKQGMDDQHMALTWHLEDRGGIRRVGHGGATLGQQAQLTLVPERGFAVAVLTNSGRGGTLNRDVIKAALREFLQVEDRDPEPMAGVTAEALAEYAGLYSRPFAEATVTVKDGRLQVAGRQKQGFPTRETPIPPPAPAVAVALYAKDRVIGVEGPAKGLRGEFLRDASGRVAYFRWGGRIAKRVP